MSRSPFHDFLEKPSVALRNQLLEHYYPLVDRGAIIGVREGWGDIEDLKSICLDQLIDAIERYDPASGKPFEPYAIAKMKWAMKAGSWNQPISLNELMPCGNRDRLSFVADHPPPQPKTKKLSAEELGLIQSVLRELPDKVQAISQWHFLNDTTVDIDPLLATVRDFDRYVNEIVDLIAQVKSGNAMWFDVDQMTKWQDSELIFDLVTAAIAHLKDQKQPVTLDAVAQYCRLAQGYFWSQPRALNLIRAHHSMVSVESSVELAIQRHLASCTPISLRSIAQSAKLPMATIKKNMRLVSAIRRAEKQQSLADFRQQILNGN